MIFQISELKGLITLFKGLDTREGKKVSETRWTPQDPIEYESEIKHNDVLERVGDAQKIVDSIQDSVDQYNHETKVVVNDVLFDMV